MGFSRVRIHNHTKPNAIFVTAVRCGRCHQMSRTYRHDVIVERLPLLCEGRSVLIQTAISRDDKECVCILEPKFRRSFLPHFQGSTRSVIYIRSVDPRVCHSCGQRFTRRVRFSQSATANKCTVLYIWSVVQLVACSLSFVRTSLQACVQSS